jgi:hypothetical protein
LAAFQRRKCGANAIAWRKNIDAPMKRYKVTLTIGGLTFVHATHYLNEGKWTRFYRDDSLIAEFATVSVIKVEEIRRLEEPPSTKGGRARVRI